jgi:hypothetical protein
LSKEYDTQKLLVVDGQQRLRTLEYFYNGVFKPTNREFALSSVQEEFAGTTIKTLKAESRRRLDDSIIHATIMKQDEPSEDNSSIYYIFERLNTGGTPLSPQEIRTCIFQGEFCELLKELNENKTWRSIYGKHSSRMRDQELILRFFALYYNGNKYAKPMKKFLNAYMGKNRHLKHQSREGLSNLFACAIETAISVMGTDAFKYKRGILASLFDCGMVGMSRRLEKGPIRNLTRAKEKYMELLTNGDFVNLILESTSDESNVASRLNMATKAFADVQ